MRIPERDVTYIVCLLTYVYQQISTESEVAQFAGPPICHLPANVISATVALAYINLQPEYELPCSTRFRQFQKFGNN